MARRGPRLSSVLVVAGAFAVAAPGWVVAPHGPAAGGVAASGRRADWQPSPIPKDWEAPVLPPRGAGQGRGAPVAPGPQVAQPVGPAGALVQQPGPAPAGGAQTARPTVPATPTGGAAQRPVTTPTVAATVAATATPAAAAGGAARTAATTTPAGTGEWHEEHLESRALGRRMPFLIWLPPGYTTSRRYPVVYMLHGGGDGRTPGRAEWLQLGMREALDQAAAAGELPPTIFVFPEGLDGYWVNHADGGPRWADYVVQDVVAHVDRQWATEARPERRAIGGLSMGGHGALHLALNHPDVFRIAGAHSPALRSHKDSPPFFGDEAHFAKFDPLTLATRGRPAGGLHVWIDVGDNDRWRSETERLAEALQKGGAKVELRRFPGRHEGGYWKAHLRDYVEFYGKALGVR